MKIRSDFVSNSSSSSFIISKTEVFKYFKISKDTIFEALDDLWLEDKIDRNSTEYYPYDVYEMPMDRAKAIRAHGLLLQGWNQNLITSFEDWSVEQEQIKAFQSLIDALKHIDPSWYLINGSDEDLNDSCVPDYVKKIVKLAREKLCIRSADEVLLSDDTQFFIHFDDNMITSIKGISDEQGKTYDSLAYTSNRFVEVLFNWLVEHGKIDPKDKGLLSLYPASDYAKKDDANKISWLDDDTYNWKYFAMEGISHAVFHEG